MLRAFMMRFIFLIALGFGLSACSASLDEASDATVRWEPEARVFFDDYCVRCHTTGHSGGDYTRYEEVVADAEVMRCGMAAEELAGCGPPMPEPRSFPTGVRPPEEEIEQVIDWLEAGAPK